MATSNGAPPNLSVLVLTYPAMDLLDIVGPLEVFSRATNASNKSFFAAKLAGPPTVSTAQWTTITPDISYEKALSSLDDFDILLVPGGPSEAFGPHLTDGAPMIQIIRAFSTLAPRTDAGGAELGRDRILMSVCTGAFFLAYLGIFNGRKCTTHYMTARYAAGPHDFKTVLSRAAKAMNEREGEFVRAAWVDSGKLPSGTRVFDTGGITNGMDGALRLVEELYGTEVKERAVGVMDYNGLERKGAYQGHYNVTSSHSS